MSNKESYGIVGNRCFGSACGAGWLTVLPESRPWSLGAGQTGTACRRWRKTVGVVSRCTSCAQRPVAAFGLSGRRRPSKSRPATLRPFSQGAHQSRPQTGGYTKNHLYIGVDPALLFQCYLTYLLGRKHNCGKHFQAKRNASCQSIVAQQSGVETDTHPWGHCRNSLL